MRHLIILASILLTVSNTSGQWVRMDVDSVFITSFAVSETNLFAGTQYIGVFRSIYSRIDMYSIGSGFISFITSGPGQKIILDNGMVPVTMPIRLVELTNRGVQP